MDELLDVSVRINLYKSWFRLGACLHLPARVSHGFRIFSASAVQNVRHGRPYLSRSVQKDVSIIGGRFQLIATSPFDALTPGELALFLAFFVEGLPGKAAAELLDMSRPAEFSSWYRMYTRLGVHDRFEGFMLAREYFSLDD